MDAAVLYSRYYHTDPRPIVDFLVHLAASHGLEGALDVADVGCGPGRMLPLLAAQGWHAVGFEPDAEFARAASQHAAVIEGGFDALEARPAYDLVIAINDPYLYMLDIRERRRAIAAAHGALRPGGLLVLDQSNFHWILRNYDPTKAVQTITFPVNGCRVTRSATHELDYHRGVLTHVDQFSWSDEHGEQTCEKVHRFAIAGPAEIDLFLAEAGFSDVRTYNAFTDRAPSPLRGKQMTFVATRPPRRA